MFQLSTLVGGPRLFGEPGGGARVPDAVKSLAGKLEEPGRVAPVPANAVARDALASGTQYRRVGRPSTSVPDRVRARWGDLIAHRDRPGRGHGRPELARQTLEGAP